jgi:hypothetical protein
MRTSTLPTLRLVLFGLLTTSALAGCDRRTSDPPPVSAPLVGEAAADPAPTVSDRVRVLLDADPLLSPAARLTTIVVTDGVVTLYGETASEAERVRIGRTAAVIVGDANVRNELRVMTAPELATAETATAPAGSTAVTSSREPRPGDGTTREPGATAAPSGTFTEAAPAQRDASKVVVILVPSPYGPTTMPAGTVVDGTTGTPGGAPTVSPRAGLLGPGETSRVPGTPGIVEGSTAPARTGISPGTTTPTPSTPAPTTGPTPATPANPPATPAAPTPSSGGPRSP